MCDIGKAFDRAFGSTVDAVSSFFKGPDLSGVTAALNAGNKAAKDASERALQMQKDAMQVAAAAAMPASDSEGARRAGEDRMRKLLAASPGAGKRFLGDAPVGYRLLTGQ